MFQYCSFAKYAILLFINILESFLWIKTNFLQWSLCFLNFGLWNIKWLFVHRLILFRKIECLFECLAVCFVSLFQISGFSSNTTHVLRLFNIAFQHHHYTRFKWHSFFLIEKKDYWSEPHCKKTLHISVHYVWWLMNDVHLTNDKLSFSVKADMNLVNLIILMIVKKEELLIVWKK